MFKVLGLVGFGFRFQRSEFMALGRVGTVSAQASKNVGFKRPGAFLHRYVQSLGVD